MTATSAFSSFRRTDGVARPGWGLALLSMFGAALAVVQIRRLDAARVNCRAAIAAWPVPDPADADAPAGRVIILGDSTGVGIGADSPERTVAGLLAAARPGIVVVNASSCGARVADLSDQWEAFGAGHAWDAVLIHAGGNDCLRLTRSTELQRQVECLARALGPARRRAVWLGPADVGTAPAFVPPLSWWLSTRTRQVCGGLSQACREAGMPFLRFDRDGTFIGDKARYFAADGIHPSGDAYVYCFQRLMRSGAPIARWMADGSALRSRRSRSTIAGGAVDAPGTARRWASARIAPVSTNLRASTMEEQPLPSRR